MKTLKNLDTCSTSNCHSCPRNGAVCFYNAAIPLTDLDEMANSVDPNQTASLRRSLIWVCIVCPELSVSVLRIQINPLSAKQKLQQTTLYFFTFIFLRK